MALGFELPNLGEDFEMLGHWWLPDAPDSPIVGVFASRSGNLSLKLLGNFESINLNSTYHKTPVILGAAEAKEITLVDCFQNPCGMKAPGTIEQNFSPRMAFIGALLPKGSESEFESWSVQPRDLGPWLSQPAIIDKMTFGESNRFHEFSYSYQSGYSPTFAIQRLAAELSYGYSVSTHSSRYRSAGIDVAAYMSLKPSQPEKWSWFQDNFQWLLDLHSCLFGRRTVVERIFAIPAGLEGGERSIVSVVEGHGKAPTTKEMEPWEVLMPLPQIQDILSDCFHKWLDSLEKIREPVGLLLSAEESNATELRLLVICQALEAFHRNTYGGQYLSVDDYEPIRKAIVSAIPDGIDSSLRTSLKSRIQFGYQYSLGKRLDLLLKSLDLSTLDQFGIGRDFAQEVKDARNLFTHWDLSSANGAPTGLQLLKMVSKLHVLARLILLKFIGIDEQIAAKRMYENRHRYLPEYVSLQ